MAPDSNARNASPEDNPLAPKRRAARRNRAIELELGGGVGDVRFQARTVDLSREGMFVEVVDPAFWRGQPSRGIVAFASRAREHFPEGLTAHFTRFGISVRADVVRVAQQPGKSEEEFGLGCRFATPLSDAQCATLGLAAAAKVDAAAAKPARPAPPRPSTPPPVPRREPAVPVAADDGDPWSKRAPGERTTRDPATARATSDLDLPPARLPAAEAPRAPVAKGDAPKPSLPLASPLLAKREERRVERRFPLVLVGTGGRWKARTVDVSPGGALVELTDADFLGESSRTLLGFARRANQEFAEGAVVEFGGGAVAAYARVVRAVAGGDGVAGARIGFRFDPSIPAAKCAALGIPHAEDATSDPVLSLLERLPAIPTEPPARVAAPAPAPAPIASAAPLPPPVAPTAPTAPTARAAPAPPAAPVPAPAAGPSSPDSSAESLGDLISEITRRGPVRKSNPPGRRAPKGSVLVHLFPRNGSLAGPRYVGVLQSVRSKAVQVDLDLPAEESDPVSFAAGVGRDVRAVFLREGRVLWEVNLKTVFVTDPGAPPRARLTFVSQKAPPKGLSRRSEPRAASA
jgi:hypothetical protein